MSDLLFPRHEAGLYLTHNDHKNVYESVEQWAEPLNHEWVSNEQKKKAIETDCVWCLQWYPDTPIGSYSVMGCDLEAVLAAALAIQKEDDARNGFSISVG